MGDEAQKRTTDCVYFLASPLTCKKGNDCEYRHSEAARINPRDCWYWLSGNCLNANCSFRHPPLDGRPGASAPSPSPSTGGTSAATTAAAASGTASSSSTIPAAASTSKSTVPCFFFSQGYCAKGGKCPFLHGPPTHFRKEATTYRKPQVSEQSANGEGNGFSYVKQQSQDNKLASQMKPPVKAATYSQESGFTPSNVYKLTAPGVPVGSSVPSSKHLPGLAGEKTYQNYHVGRSKLAHNANDNSTRQGQSVESRISQAHMGDSTQQIAPGDKGGMKGQLPLQLDLGRRIQKQGRQTNATYHARTSEDAISTEMQDPMSDTDAQHGARELHAGDLRNHLKRKKNDTVYVSQLKSFHGKEYPKERLESGRLASRAVAVVEGQDFMPSNVKRAKEDKENFSGPKTLAQIKAEKIKAGAENSLKAADCRSQGQGMVVSDLEVKRKVQLASEIHVNPLPEFEPKKAELPILSTTEDLEGPNCKSSVLRPGVGTEVSNGVPSHLLPLREVETAAFHSSENAEKHDDHKVDVASIPVGHSKEGKADLRSVGSSRGGMHSHHNNVDRLTASTTETGYISADDLMEDGTEALENPEDAMYASDYDEEDDFAKKLGSFLS